MFWKAAAGAFVGRTLYSLFGIVFVLLGFGPENVVNFLITGLPQWVTPELARGLLLFLGLTTFIGLIWPSVSRQFARHEPTDMTARQAIEWIAHESKWAWGNYYAANHERMARMAAPKEFDRSAREGIVSVRGHGFVSGKYGAIDRDHWNVAGLDVLDVLNPRGSKGRTELKDFVNTPLFYDLLVDRKVVINTWPKAGKFYRLIIKARLFATQVWSMAIGKYLNLSEARKKKKLERFAKQHPSAGDEDQFDSLLHEMAKKPESDDQTSDSSRRDED